MRTYYKLLVVFLVGAAVASCQKVDEINIDPNNPSEVSTATLLTGSQKKMLDYVYDNWFSGRQALPYAQYWCQRNYTEEDRYQIRESVNNNYFNYFYVVAGNYDLIEKLNTDASTKSIAVLYGDNTNQIAVAKILKTWLMQVVADTWGNVPYSQAFKLNDGIKYPKYDDLTELYPALIEELQTAISMIDESKQAFYSGDEIYNGDPKLWKKFAYSLKARLALRLSKVDPNWKTYMADVIANPALGFTDNDEEAFFKYSTEAPNECSFYRGFFVDARNDFSITKPFCDLLKGQRDTLNNKQHPWENVVDPRLAIYTTPRNGLYKGLPYGVPSSSMNSAIRNAAPTWYNASNHPAILNKDFSVPLMTYAEYCFILSEANGFSAPEYQKGIRASISHWTDLAGVELSQTDVDSYVAAVSGTVNAETVATQKYIHLYMQGTEAWAEYRRTGYPKTLLKPEEYSYDKAGTLIKFSTLSDTKGDLPARVKYPTNESTLNPDGFKNAIAKLTDGVNNYYSKMFWDVRTASNPYPANK